MLILKVIIIVVAAYLLGSVSIAVLLSKFVKHEDVRDKGSGNAGATNVARVYGMKFGLITLFGDVAKTLIAALIGHLLLKQPGVAIACAACIVGHCWPVFFGFKGGKGVAVGAAIIGVIDWRVLIIALSVFIVIAVITRYVSLGSMLAGMSFPIMLPIIGHPTWYQEVLAVFVALVIIFLHRENLMRLLNHTEYKF